MVHLKPLNNLVLVKQEKTKTQTKSGLFIPESAQEKPMKGIVIEVSPKIDSIKINDTILYGKWSGTKVKVEGESYLLVKEEDILGIIEE